MVGFAANPTRPPPTNIKLSAAAVGAQTIHAARHISPSCGFSAERAGVDGNGAAHCAAD
jgi:hypothetical protein